MGKKSDPPPPPDPREVASAQTGQNVGTAIANTLMGQVDQVGPDGSLTYDQTGSFQWRDPSSGQVHTIPRFTATTTLSEDAQQLRDANNRGNIALSNLGADQAERVGDILADPFDPNSITPARADRSGAAPITYDPSVAAPTLSRDTRSLPGLSSPGDSLNLETGYQSDFSGERQQVIDALMGQLNDQRGKDLESLRSDLYNRGVREGSEAYSRAMEDFDRSVDDRRLSAILAGGQEHSRLTNLARDEAAFGNDATSRMYFADEDARRYGDAMDLSLFGLGTDQLNFNNLTDQTDFNNRRSVQARDDGVLEANWDQQNQIWDATDRSRADALDEAYAARTHPINEITALLSGSQVATPRFAMAQPDRMPTTDVAGITQQGYQNEFAAWNAQQQREMAMMGGLFGLAGAGVSGGIGPSWLYGGGG